MAGRRGKRFTPVSDYLHDSLRYFLKSSVLEDDEYAVLFDELEAPLAVVATDENWKQRKWALYAWRLVRLLHVAKRTLGRAHPNNQLETS